MKNQRLLLPATTSPCNLARMAPAQAFSGQREARDRVLVHLGSSTGVGREGSIEMWASAQSQAASGPADKVASSESAAHSAFSLHSLLLRLPRHGRFFWECMPLLANVLTHHPPFFRIASSVSLLCINLLYPNSLIVPI